MIKLTAKQEITPYKWVRPRGGNGREAAPQYAGPHDFTEVRVVDDRLTYFAWNLRRGPFPALLPGAFVLLH